MHETLHSLVPFCTEILQMRTKKEGDYNQIKYFESNSTEDCVCSLLGVSFASVYQPLPTLERISPSLINEVSFQMLQHARFLSLFLSSIFPMTSRYFEE